MLGERIASQSEVIRAIVSGYSPCCGGPHLLRELLDALVCVVLDTLRGPARLS